MESKIGLILCTGFVLIGLALPARGQTVVDIAPRGGYEIEQESITVGGELRVHSLSLPFIFTPSFDFYLDGEEPNDVDFQIDINALVPFGLNNRVFTPYAGGGFSVQFFNDEQANDNSDLGFNGVGGATFNPQGRLRPFVQGRVTFTRHTLVNVTGGLLINVSRP